MSFIEPNKNGHNISHFLSQFGDTPAIKYTYLNKIGNWLKDKSYYL